MARTRVGYTGGSTPQPTYRKMGDHTESLQIDFRPEVISYAELLELFWSAHNPTREIWSRQYMAAVFCADQEQQQLAQATAQRLAEELGKPPTTRVCMLERFYRAEDYHQKYKLRRERDITAELVARFGSDRQMVDSTVAARLNSYLGGWSPRGAGKRRMLEAQLAELELSEASTQRLLARVA